MSNQRIVLITGANAGLGYEIVRALCGSDRAFTVLLGGRSVEKARQARETVLKEFPICKGSVEAVNIDVEDDDSIQALQKTVESKYGKIDILVNNAGGQFDSEYRDGRMTARQAWNKAWDLNVTSAHIMTSTFVPLLLKSDDPRIIFMASATSSLTTSENPALPVNKAPPKGWPKPRGTIQNDVPSYRSSKTGMNMMMREWHLTLAVDGVKVWAISPGFLATGLARADDGMKKLGALDPSIGGNFVKDVIEGKRDADVGKVVADGRYFLIQPW